MHKTSSTTTFTTVPGRSTTGLSDVNQIPSSEEASHLDSVLVADLATVNTLVAKYILRTTEVASREGAEISPADERSLADMLTSVADGLRARASRRERNRER